MCPPGRHNLAPPRSDVVAPGCSLKFTLKRLIRKQRKGLPFGAESLGFDTQAVVRGAQDRQNEVPVGVGDRFAR